jgi:hypothetical protein
MTNTGRYVSIGGYLIPIRALSTEAVEALLSNAATYIAHIRSENERLTQLAAMAQEVGQKVSEHDWLGRSSEVVATAMSDLYDTLIEEALDTDSKRSGALDMLEIVDDALRLEDPDAQE